MMMGLDNPSKIKRIFLFFMMVFLVSGVSQKAYLYSQYGGFKYIGNFTAKEYDEQPQNWAVLQDKRGIIYAGNHGCLLEFDGISWRKIDIPNRCVRSMAIDDAGNIYIGGNNEIGYLAPDSRGTLHYISLKNYLEDKCRNFSDVWKTYSTEKGIYFQAKEFLFRWSRDNQPMKVWEPGERFYFSFYCGGKFFIREKNIGLMQMVNDSLKLIPGGKEFAEKSIYMMVKYRDNSEEVLIGTLDHGFYIFDGQTVKPFPTGVDNYVKENRLYYGIRLTSSSGERSRFALATREGGLIIIDPDGNPERIFNKDYGLLDDNVKYVFEDFQGNLWLALDNGISKIEYDTPVFIYAGRSNINGLILSVVKHDGDLYIGTTRGLYVLESPDEFRPVPVITTPCWFLLSVGNSLLAAASTGVFRLGNNVETGAAHNRFHRIVPGPSYVMVQSQKDNRRVWVGTEEGLISLYLQQGVWAVEYTFKHIKQEIRTIVEEPDGNLWAGTLANGVVKFDFSGAAADPHITSYGTSHGLPSQEVHVFMAVGHVMFGTGEGLYRFDDKNNRFIPDFTLGRDFADGSRGVFRIAEDKKKNIWLHSRLRNFKAVPGADGSFDLFPIPVLRTHVVQVNYIYPDPDGSNIWFAGNEGLVRYDTSIKKDYRPDFRTLIRRVDSYGEVVFDGLKSLMDKDLKQFITVLAYRNRNLRFNFAAAFFEAETETQYRCFLEGYNDDWGEWGTEVYRDYTNLDPGLYTFKVQARNVYDHPGREDSFKFRVLPPWYRTWWAYLSYGALFFTAMLFFIKWRSGKLVREKQKLERIVIDRTKEIKDKNRKLEEQTFQLKEQSEKLKEMDRVKSRFFANISHEFRTPLTLIMGPMEQILAGNRDKDLKNQLNLMLRNSHRLLTLINQLLDLSRFDSGKMKLQAAPQNIVPFLKGIMASFEQLAVQKKLAVKFMAESEVEDISLYFDSPKMEQVFTNLLINAVKFTPAGGEIVVSVKRGQPREGSFPAGFIEISVCDTGIGIPQEKLPHIFDRFYQVERPGSPDHKGTGIGLALTGELAALHHGKIDVHSREGMGTEFVIHLPLGNEHLKADEVIDPAQFQSSAIREKTGEIPDLYVLGDETGEEEKERECAESGREPGPEAQARNIILVVEDNPDVRKYIREPLEPIYAVIEAKDGKEGIARAKEVIPDLIISDIMMPHVDGYELCGVLKRNIETCHIPIILLTAKASEESMIQGLETGADDYITKPFNTKVLSIRIKNLIDLRRQLQLKIQRKRMLLPAEISVSSMDEAFLKELQDIVEKNLADPDFDIEHLCKGLYMGRSTLYRKVEALTGETPNQFIQSYRLERAAQLLKANFGNITEVAFEVGFSSSAYFTKCFKEKFHRLPSTFLASES
jgi:signal transduction histidine kinase/DNA-binding NarL/FixJ family response regulator